jgi:hypothetical protein
MVKCKDEKPNRDREDENAGRRQITKRAKGTNDERAEGIALSSQ